MAGYTLAFGALLIPAGRLGDRHGHARVFRLGTTGFALSSLLCALAPISAVLIAARLLQGVAAALMVPQVLSLIQLYFPESEQPRALGAFGAVNGLAAVIGPLLAGGLLTLDLFHWFWRWIFLINVPLGLLTTWLAVRTLYRETAQQGQPLDLPGAVLVTLGLVALLAALIQGRELSWALWIDALGVLSALLGLFLGWEKRQSVRGQEVMVPPRLFGKQSFSAGLLLNLLFVAGIAALFFALTLTLQGGLRWSPMQVGLVILPFSFAVAVGSGLSTVLVGRLGRRILQLGTLLMTAGTVGLAGFFQSTSGPGLWPLILCLGVCGLGMGLLVAPLLDFVLQGTDRKDAGAASGLLGAVGPVGQALGVALFGTVFYSLGANSAALTKTLWLIAGLFAVCWALVFALSEREGRSEARRGTSEFPESR